MAPGSGPPAIVTPRLRLVPLHAGTIRALLVGDRALASREQGSEIPPDFTGADDEFFLRIQLERMESDPERRAWCARVMVRAADGAVVGHCGFHGPPETVGRAEIGYTVVPEQRGQGYATEAAGALLTWAREQGATTVFASVAPTNHPSRAVVRKLGFVLTGSQIDEIDGEELVFELSLT